MQDRWGKTYANGERLTRLEAIRLLKNKMSLHPVRNTILIEIQVFSEKPQRGRRDRQCHRQGLPGLPQGEKDHLTGGGIDVLLAQRKAKEAEIDEAQTNLDRLRRKLKIPDSMANEYAPAPLLTADSLRHVNALRLEFEAQFVSQETLLADLKTLDATQLVQTLPTAVQDNLLGSFLEQKNIADQRLLAIDQDLGTNNPILIKARASQADLQDKIDKRVKGIMAGIAVKVDALERGLTESRAKSGEGHRGRHRQGQRKPALFRRQAQARGTHKVPQPPGQQDLRGECGPSAAQEHHGHDYRRRAARSHAGASQQDRSTSPWASSSAWWSASAWPSSSSTSTPASRPSMTSSAPSKRPVLGVIPQNVGLMLDEGAESPHAEAYRVLRTNILFSRKDDKLNSMAVVSAGAGEGKSTTVFNLASIFAQSGQRVIVVDSDLRRPTLHKMLHVTNSIGLTNYLLKQNSLEEVIQTTNNPSLDFLASGKLPSSSLGILSSAQMKDLISELKQRYDFVFFDSPPIMGVSDASILASEMDMTLQVIQYRRYPQPMNIRAKQLIEKVGGNLVGIVLNNINMSQDESYYYYSGYYHDYYYRSSTSEESDSAPGSPSAPKDGKGKADSQEKPKLDIKPKY